MVTVAVIGNTMAGKTSLIKTLQDGNRRILTNRAHHHIVDETTKVFNIEELSVEDTVLRLIDMGGQPVYHMTYQLTLRENCIPVVVVSMEQYDGMSQKIHSREAVRRLAFDWLAHLYLANPGIGPPNLVFTHKDKFDDENFSRLKKAFVATANKLWGEVLHEEQYFGPKEPRIIHFLSFQNFFPDENIYEIGKEKEYDVYDKLKSAIFKKSQEFFKVLPMLWENVNNKVLGLPTTFTTIEEIFLMSKNLNKEITREQMEIILTYMHDCGRLLWYKNIDSLKAYVFHNIKEVTGLLTVLFNHSHTIWKERTDHFRPCLLSNRNLLEKEHFDVLAFNFLSTGIISECLLEYLIKAETAFVGDSDTEVAVTLLQQFYLLFGPLMLPSYKVFVVPYFAHDYLSNSFCSDGDFKLQMEIMFKGLAVPHYVYQQMSIVVLKMFPDDISSVNVKRNGVKVSSGGVGVLLVHDSLSRKVEIKVSSAVNQVPHAWSLLVDTTRNISREVQTAWPGCKMVHKSICSHCLLKDDPHPNKSVSPSWCHDFGSTYTHSFFGKEFLTVLCGEDEIPSPFVHPCKLAKQILIPLPVP